MGSAANELRLRSGCDDAPFAREAAVGCAKCSASEGSREGDGGAEAGRGASGGCPAGSANPAPAAAAAMEAAVGRGGGGGSTRPSVGAPS